MSQFSAGSKATSPSSSPPNDSPLTNPPKGQRSSFVNHQRVPSRPLTPPSNLDYGTPLSTSPNSNHSTPNRQRSSSRPLSMVMPFIPPSMDVNEDTIPELQPIFSFLNTQQNKLYHEGYFLKLDDQNTQGQPNADRTWTECYAQLVGTVMSFWDAAELDAVNSAGGEVLPKFLNLTDASLKMIDSLPTRSADEKPLENILSISTAGRNRYLLHFNNHDVLIQWTAAIRLAIYEQNTLQEAYTGALIAGKGKTLNNINVIMERSRFKVEEWVRVRFGAGMPWRRCWCVITPPDEKEYAKLQKEMKKRSPYDRSHVPVLKGDIKFYDTRKDGKKQKKAHPIATITDAYSAYAIYPTTKDLVDTSTLLKVEGNVTINSNPPTSSEGFVFIMPEARPMVSGFEMLLRFLFPTWDTFGLYGRPGKLVASILDPRSLMFAMPKHRRYGYLELVDVIALLAEGGNSSWNEEEWRKKLKESTGTRMSAIEDGTRSPHSRSDSRGSAQTSGNRSRSQSLSSSLHDAPPAQHPPMPNAPFGRMRTDSDPTSFSRPGPPGGPGANLAGDFPLRGQTPLGGSPPDGLLSDSFSSDSERGGSPPTLGPMRDMNTPEPVSRPPEFGHPGQQRPTSRVYHSPDLRRANNRLSNSTLSQIAKTGGLGLPQNNNTDEPRRGGMEDHRMPGPSVHSNANSLGISANDSREAVNSSPFGGVPPSLGVPQGPQNPYAQSSDGSRPQTSEGRRSPYPPNGPGPGPGPGPRPPPHGFPGGPLPQGRGRPPPGNGPPPQDFYGRGRGSGPRPPPHQGPPQPFPDRTTSMDKHSSMTPDAIIDHYVTDHGRGHDDWPREPNYQREPDRSERPRVGVLKTVGGDDGAPPPMRNNFDIPDVEFGPTFNYGAGPPRHQPGPGPNGPHGQRPYSPAGPRPGTAGRGSPAGPHGPQQRRHDEPGRTVPWHPSNSSAAPGQLGPAPPNHGHPRPMQAGGPPPHQGDPRFRPPQNQYPGGPGPNRPPPQRNVHPQYQGQAF
ncbi:unnamed protein product [Clonostachys rosea]|uniref:PH domain-containing protein n=1 Tax=Bionectria ochroleuca TaxID=29856 RepID=A0ABY6TP42_BIOOC|nr:unnamed protein product [Clonostachys rosea]